MGTPRPVVDPRAVREAAQRRVHAEKEMLWWRGRILHDAPLTAAEWQRYRDLLDALDPDGLVEFYKATVGEPVGQSLRESIREHHRRGLGLEPD